MPKSHRTRRHRPELREAARLDCDPPPGGGPRRQDCREVVQPREIMAAGRRVASRRYTCTRGRRDRIITVKSPGHRHRRLRECADAGRHRQDIYPLARVAPTIPVPTLSTHAGSVQDVRQLEGRGRPIPVRSVV